MEINSATSTARTTLTLSNVAPQLLSLWQQGQPLQARVIAIESNQRVLLDIAGQSIRAQTQMELSPGQRLDLLVLRAGPPPLLQLSIAESSVEKMTQALRKALPQQVALIETIQAFQQLLNPNNAIGRTLTPQIVALIQAWFAKLPGLRSLSQGQGLQQAVRDSGIFFESLLARTAHSELGAAAQFPDDLKLRLLQLSKQLQRSIDQAAKAGRSVAVLEQLLAQTESALSRIQLQQLQSLMHSEEIPTWFFELPVHNDDHHETIQMRIKRESSADEKELWKVRLRFDFDKLGAIEAWVTVSDGQASVSFNTEQLLTAELFSEHMPDLQTDLAAYGLQTGTLQARQGKLNEETPLSEGVLAERVLVDEKA